MFYHNFSRTIDSLYNRKRGTVIKEIRIIIGISKILRRVSCIIGVWFGRRLKIKWGGANILAHITSYLRFSKNKPS